MNTQEAQKKISELLEAAEYENEWGGSETSDGCLMPGNVDWPHLKAEIMAVLDSLPNTKDTAP